MSFFLSQRLHLRLNFIYRFILNKNLEEQCCAIYKSWFVDFSRNNNCKPDTWLYKTIDDLTLLVTRGITPKYDEFSDEYVINQKCIRNHVIDLSLARTHLPKVVNDKWLCFGDLLINSTGTGTLGRAAQIWFKPEKLTVDTHVTIVRPKSSVLIYYIGLWGLNHEGAIEDLHTGSTGQTELPRDMIKNMPIILPDNDTLLEFNKLIKPITEQIVLNQQETIKLEQLRDILLPKLISGELDVSNIDL